MRRKCLFTVSCKIRLEESYSKSDVSLPTSLDTLLNRAGENINTLPSIGKVSSGNAHTIQSGYVEISGEHHDRYLMIASQIPVNSNQIYNLTVLTRKASLWNLFWNHLPVYGLIWFLSFLCVLFLCRSMSKKAFSSYGTDAAKSPQFYRIRLT